VVVSASASGRDQGYELFQFREVSSACSLSLLFGSESGRGGGVPSWVLANMYWVLALLLLQLSDS